MPAAVRSAFDVAFWFLDKALDDQEYLQPQKLQRLMFLAQSYYGALNGGRKLMPAVFVADDLGPLEPNVHLAFSNGRPNVDCELFLPTEAETILKGVWRRFGQHSADHLSRMTKHSPAYLEAYGRGPRGEISFEAMCRAVNRDKAGHSPDRLAAPKMMVTQSGRAVSVRKWSPPEATGAKGRSGAPA